ncbi:MAG: DUF3990 domain-containing protein [Agathobacter sp.]
MKKIIYHGSEQIVLKPQYGLGSTTNDYGRGFYCTESPELAKEWACKRERNGFVNCYSFEMDGLSICNLNEEPYHILNWLAVLTRYRSYWQRNSIAEEAKDFLQTNFYVDVSQYDVIVGYRADDSYFSFAQDFIMGTISLEKLSKAMKLGKLGEQIVLKSEKAFSHLSYQGNEEAFAEIYYVKKANRDLKARQEYMKEKKNSSRVDEIYMIDIMRGRVKSDDLRIQ